MIVNLLDDIPHGATGQMTPLDHQTIYDKAADGYGRSHDRWLRHAGGEAQCAFEGAVTALLQPGMRVIDVACGTGTVARRLRKGAGGAFNLTLLDVSPAMLDHCSDIPATRVVGCMKTLPFPDNTFDLLTCAWGIETVDDPAKALAEFMRVTRPGGHICIVHCADRPAHSLLGRALRHRITTSGRGRFLSHDLLSRQAAMIGAKRIQTLHCTGPAAAMLVHV